MINKYTPIYLAGHLGLVGSSILKKLKQLDYKNIIVASRKQLDLLNQDAVISFFKKKKPKAVILAAARVGGIVANNIYRTEFIYENLQLQNNLIFSAFKNGVKNLVFLGSSCVYPKFCKQPIKEEYLLNGKLEETNEPYAVAKIAGIKLCESLNIQFKTNYKCLMPANAYGPNDNYDEFTSHFFPALIKKVYDFKKKKKKIILWGSGKVKRELIFVDDIADACIFFLKKKTKETVINIGTGKDHTIKYYLEFIKKKLKVNAFTYYDKKKPDGTPRKLLNISLARSYGWKPKTSLEAGFNLTYREYLKII